MVKKNENGVSEKDALVAGQSSFAVLAVTKNVSAAQCSVLQVMGTVWSRCFHVSPRARLRVHHLVGLLWYVAWLGVGGAFKERKSPQYAWHTKAFVYALSQWLIESFKRDFQPLATHCIPASAASVAAVQ